MLSEKWEFFCLFHIILTFFLKKIRFYRVSPVLGICVEAVDVVVDICLWKSKKKKLNNSLLDLWET